MDALTIIDLYAKYQDAEGHAKKSSEARREAGLALGKALYDLRSQSEVVPGGTSFDRQLKDVNVPRRTAYRWIKKYELSIGISSHLPEVEIKILGINYDAPSAQRQSADKLCRNARKIATEMLFSINGGNRENARYIAEGCKNREQLDLLVRDLQETYRRIGQVLPLIEAVLAATPTEEQRAQVWARLRAEESAATGLVN